MRRTLTTLVGVLAAALVLAACPGDGAAPDTTTSIEVTGTDALRFAPDSFSVPAGEQVTVSLTSEASVDHDFTIEEIGDEVVVHADAGQTETGTFTIDETGTYTVYCTIPGHRQAGMVATLEVVDG